MRTLHVDLPLKSGDIETDHSREGRLSPGKARESAANGGERLSRTDESADVPLEQDADFHGQVPGGV